MDDQIKAMFAELDAIKAAKGEGPEFFAAMQRWLERLYPKNNVRGQLRRDTSRCTGM